MAKVEYNNNIFSFKGKIGRISYIIQNSIINIIGFKFIYYPAMGKAYHTMLTTPGGADLVQMLSEFSIYAALFKFMAAAPAETAISITLKYLFLIPLRLIDIKRIRDIMNDSLSTGKTFFFAVFLSIPYIDLLATVALSIIGPNRYAKSEFEQEIKYKDLDEAREEGDLASVRKLFEEGKISRADYLKAREKNSKS
jgi:uncharacterized membrane protein YhaH (DUF805 family)